MLQKIVLNIAYIVLYIFLVSTFLSFGMEVLLLFWLFLGLFAVSYDLSIWFKNNFNRVCRALEYKRLKKKGSKLNNKQQSRLNRIRHGKR